jgi:chromosome segregation ATPase
VSVVLDEIVQSARQVDELASKVSANSQDQRRSHEEVSKAVEDIEKVTHLNVLKAEESATAAETLNGQVEEMRLTLQELSALIRGGKRARGSKDEAIDNTNSRTGADEPAEAPTKAEQHENVAVQEVMEAGGWETLKGPGAGRDASKIF